MKFSQNFLLKLSLEILWHLYVVIWNIDMEPWSVQFATESRHIGLLLAVIKNFSEKVKNRALEISKTSEILLLFFFVSLQNFISRWLYLS